MLTADSRGVFSGPSLSGNGKVLLARWEDGTHPQEIYQLAADGSKTRLTNFNQGRVKGRAWLPFEEFWCQTEACLLVLD